MIRRPPRSTPKPSSAASDVYKRQALDGATRTSALGGAAWLCDGAGQETDSPADRWLALVRAGLTAAPPHHGPHGQGGSPQCEKELDHLCPFDRRDAENPGLFTKCLLCLDKLKDHVPKNCTKQDKTKHCTAPYLEDHEVRALPAQLGFCLLYTSPSPRDS